MMGKADDTYLKNKNVSEMKELPSSLILFCKF